MSGQHWPLNYSNQVCQINRKENHICLYIQIKTTMYVFNVLSFLEQLWLVALIIVRTDRLLVLRWTTLKTVQTIRSNNSTIRASSDMFSAKIVSPIHSFFYSKNISTKSSKFGWMFYLAHLYYVIYIKLGKILHEPPAKFSKMFFSVITKNSS